MVAWGPSGPGRGTVGSVPAVSAYISADVITASTKYQLGSWGGGASEEWDVGG